ncbi:lipase family protein [Nannochloropsis gaditana]|uniref:Lipase family protein n=1 Tax=Nannochloropsis gaditana TaxID=72520 RepID=W7TGM0_9STRA|nr:lipase family protein [Nannochloropsis gaditana]
MCNLRKPDLAFLTHLVPEKLLFSSCGWRDPGAIVVAFAGTDSSSIENWISNLDAFKTDYTVGSCEDCEVHDGFMSSYAGISADATLLGEQSQSFVWQT